MINMYLIQKNITKKGISKVSREAGINRAYLYKIVEGKSNPTVEMLNKIIKCLDYDISLKRKTFENCFEESVKDVSDLVAKDGKWDIHFFNFVDAFKKGRDIRLIKDPPIKNLDVKLKALLASMVEELCMEFQVQIPDWIMKGEFRLPEPTFLSEYKKGSKLKELILKECPRSFRLNNIYVHPDFLKRG